MHRPLVLALLFAAAALSQTLQSPEVSPDHRVTFRILAPKASEVTLTGDWLGTAPVPKLNKDDHGVWSVTLAESGGFVVRALTADQHGGTNHG